jgi:hypothetical protein
MRQTVKETVGRCPVNQVYLGMSKLIYDFLGLT